MPKNFCTHQSRTKIFAFGIILTAPIGWLIIAYVNGTYSNEVSKWMQIVTQIISFCILVTGDTIYTMKFGQRRTCMTQFLTLRSVRYLRIIWATFLLLDCCTAMTTYLLAHIKFPTIKRSHVRNFVEKFLYSERCAKTFPAEKKANYGRNLILFHSQ